MGCLMFILVIGWGLIIFWLYNISAVLGGIGTIASIVIPIVWISSFSNEFSNATKTVREVIDDRFKKLESISPTQKVYSADFKTVLAIDENTKKLCILDNPSGINVNVANENKDEVMQILYDRIRERIFNYRDILEVEIIEDGVQVTKTSRSSQLGGALVGGVLAGGVGAIIGGLSGKIETSGKVKKIELKLIVNDTANPISNILFFTHQIGVDKDNSQYRNIMARATHWHGLISVLIRQADIEDKVKEQENMKEFVSSRSSSSMADELVKLADLRDKGILTQAEFEAQKSKLLTM